MQSRRQQTAGTIYPLTLLASAVLGLLALGGVMLSTPTSHGTTMTIEPGHTTVSPGETFTIHVSVTSEIPVNAFTGKITFDQKVLAVEKIEYNTSIANLWAEEPWFNEGEGSLKFTGGTTVPGGFIGTGSLVTITLRAIAPGDARLWLQDARILQHDGLGTEAPLPTPLDTVFTVMDTTVRTVAPGNTEARVNIGTISSSLTDLNQDGVTSIRDISIFMLYFATLDVRADVTGDGKVTIADASSMLGSRTQ